MINMNDAPAESPPLSALEYYNVIRHRLEHEDNLIIQRLSWLVASQSFLFTAYAIVLNGLTNPPQAASERFMTHELYVFRIIPIVAILTCALISTTILAAVHTMATLRKSY